METKRKMNVLYRRDERFPAGRMSRLEIARQRPTARVISVLGDKQHFCCFDEMYSLTILGERIFWKKLNSCSLTFKDGKFYGNIDPFNKILCKVFNFDWLANNKWAYNIARGNKTLWKSIIRGSITNPEDLVKKYSKLYFKGAYSYRALREYADNNPGISLWNLYYYCTNPDEGLRYITYRRRKDMEVPYFSEGEPTEPQEHEIRDYLTYCEMLGGKWNPKWSRKRLLLEHQKQIDTVHLSEIEEKSNASIAPAFNRDGLSLILDERTCYQEGMHMHNCVYSCYWRQIRNGTYLIAKGSVDGEYVDLGIRIEDVPILDQVHTIRNGSASADTREFCVQWIQDHKDALLNTSKAIRGGKPLEDIPF